MRGILLRAWRWLFPETTATKLRREAWAVIQQQRMVAWMLRREFFEMETRKAAASGLLGLDVRGDDVDLFRPNAPGDRWARSMGMRVRAAYGHAYKDDWSTLRWD